jgi:predicted kinase
MDLQSDQAFARPVHFSKGNLMTTLTIYRGLPGSGKSTDARNALESAETHTIIVERDILRLENPRLEGEEVFYYENKITKFQHKLIKALLEQGVDVISSDTNLRDKYVKPLLKLAHEAGAAVVWLDLRTTALETALRRNADRTDKAPIPEQYLRDSYNRFIKGRDLTVQPEYTPATLPKWRPYIQPVGAAAKRSGWLVDVDGTLAS